MTIHAVLLVPAEGDPHGLLREGPCGARPPMAAEWWVRSSGPMRPSGVRATRGGERRWCVWPGGGVVGDLSTERHALVLAWEGEVVVEGVDRYMRARGLQPHQGYSFGAVVATLRHMFAECEDSGARDLGTLVLLDAEGGR